LEKKGVIKLPARLRIRESFNRRVQTRPELFEINREEVVGKVSEFRSLTIKMVRFTPEVPPPIFNEPILLFQWTQ